jgi:hypothetical protein
MASLRLPTHTAIYDFRQLPPQLRVVHQLNELGCRWFGSAGKHHYWRCRVIAIRPNDRLAVGYLDSQQVLSIVI